MSALIFKIVRHRDAWAVEHEGQYLDHSRDKAEVTASATKRARAAAGQGRMVQIRDSSESGYF